MTALTDALGFLTDGPLLNRIDRHNADEFVLAVATVAAAARSVADAPEWLQRLLEDGYHLESPMLGDVIVLKVPPNTEGTLELAEALRDAFDRQVIVLEDGWEFDSADEIWWCQEHEAPSLWFDGSRPEFSRAPFCFAFDPTGHDMPEQKPCRMVRRPLLKVGE